MDKTTYTLDVERLARAMRWSGIRSEPEFATIEEAARQLAGDYVSPMLDGEVAPTVCALCGVALPSGAAARARPLDRLIEERISSTAKAAS